MYSVPEKYKPSQINYNHQKSKWYEDLYKLGKVKLKARELIKKTKD